MSQLAYERTGDGPPLVLVHGLGSYRRVWNPVAAALARERELIALDLPGFGDSPPLPPPLEPTPAALTDAVEALLDELGLVRVQIAGHSLGGWIGLELARRGRARSLVAFAPAGFWTAREARFASASFFVSRVVLSRLRPVLPRLAQSRGARTLLTGQYFARPWRLRGEDALEAMCNFVDSPGLHPTRRASFARRFEPEPAIDAPLTIAWGTRDAILLPRQARRAQRLLPAARLVWLDGLGHTPFSDDPALVARVALASLRAAQPPLG